MQYKGKKLLEGITKILVASQASILAISQLELKSLSIMHAINLIVKRIASLAQMIYVVFFKIATC